MMHVIAVILLMTVVQVHAATGSSSHGSSSGGAVAGLGGYGAIGFYGGIVNSTQDDLNTMQSRANINQGGITTGQLTQAYEFGPFYQYRFDGTIYALHIRPTYFYARQDGSGSAGSYTYGVTGYTIFPMLKLYPLENNFMKFYMQLGLGYGSANGMITEGAGNHVDFTSGGFGTEVGLGAELCLTSSQCISAEGNYRYLNFNRSVVTKSSGTFNASNGSLTQYGKGQELELDNSDLAIRMGGLMFMFGYYLYF